MNETITLKKLNEFAKRRNIPEDSPIYIKVENSSNISSISLITSCEFNLKDSTISDVILLSDEELEI